MFRSTYITHIKIVNLWLLFILTMVVASHFEHWSTLETLSWVNFSLFFFLFLQSLFIALKEIAHRGLFINLAIWTLFSSIQILNAFVGPGYALGGSAKLAYELVYCRSMIMPFLATYTIINVVICISFREIRPWICALCSIAIASGVAWYLYGSIFQAPLIETNPATISAQTFKLLLLPFIALLGYWVYQFKSDPPISEHIKVLLGFFFVYLVIELTDLFTMLYKIKLYAVSQVVLFSTLLFLMIIFFNRLNYISSDFGQYYERLLMNGRRAGVAIVRKQSQNLRPVFDLFQKYFFARPGYGAISFLAAIVFMSYLKAPESVFVNLAAIAIAFLLLFVYWWGLSRKRDLQHNVINFN